jgi:NAD(P)-dependent dehydrogenase (short-subunit alcohol dehydrogenase family)
MREVAKYGMLVEISEDLYDSMFNTDVKGVLLTVQEALPLMPDGASIRW